MTPEEERREPGDSCLCPFCGSDRLTAAYYRNVPLVTFCERCHVIGPPHKVEEGAYEAWNKQRST